MDKINDLAEIKQIILPDIANIAHAYMQPSMIKCDILNKKPIYYDEMDSGSINILIDDNKIFMLNRDHIVHIFDLYTCNIIRTIKLNHDDVVLSDENKTEQYKLLGKIITYRE